MELFSKHLTIETAEGEIVDFLAPSVTASERYKSTYIRLTDLLQSDRYKEVNIREAMSSDKKFRMLVEKLFTCVKPNISPYDLSYEILFKLIFPHEGDNGEYYRMGLLTRFCLGESKENEPVAKTNVDTYAKNLANLLTIFKNFDQCTSILNTLSAKDLASVIDYYADNLKTPEERKKAMAKDEAKKMLKDARKNTKEVKKLADERDTQPKPKPLKVGKELTESEINQLLNGM